MSGRWIIRSVLAGAVAAGLLGGSAAASDYETCFAFDPVFVQADQRRAARATPGKERQPARRVERAGPRPATPRLSLATLRQALVALAQPIGKPSVTPSRRGTP